ncbi:sigma-70 family RNA polymerase sigma factor [Endozoicomonas sp. G2_1]|uniref:sigma-70 family RNA polymerase sigma factor n=1 Tax=Endozoicomonas sp. G2_1 TaxID=2821091 RepID=UPI001ADCC73B|nr:sigma-70 family RNA polymerase sigma factor [Endozoicomonas sp. G2_1]MBO9489683.1 sigma-70 family RNA polymerase sigma factor [Endozoicomonas sp. G2_1]
MSSNSDLSINIDKLYQDHHQWLVSWIAGRTSGWDNAQDLAQDTFMRLLARPNTTENIRSPRAWLAKIANNLVVDQARRKILEQNYLLALANVPEAEQPSPEHQLALLALLEQIDDLLCSLRAVEKTAFLMVRLEGVSYRQVAKQLGVSLSSVEKYVAKAMFQCYNLVYGDL